MSTSDDTKKTIIRRRPAGMKPATVPENPARFMDSYEPRPFTPHDRYLTYDSKGRLITHTVYQAPPSTKPVALTFPYRKKHKDRGPKGESA